jgi:DNA-binding response OmpR family regulator
MGKALIADDDRDILDLVRAVLTNAGHDVVAVCNGIEALDRLRWDRFDFVVLDVQMPGMSGLAVLDAAKRLLPPHPPVVMLSGLTTFQDRDRGLAAGASVYLAKPFRVHELLSVIDGLLQGSSHCSDHQLRSTSDVR